MQLPLPPPTTYFVASETTSPKFGQAFAEGCGGKLTNVTTRLQPEPWAGFASPALWPLLDQALAESRDYYYGDHAFWGRGRYYRIARNAVQFQPTIADLSHARPHRLRVVGIDTIADWKRDGRSIILCPNSTIYMQRFNTPAEKWIADCTTAIQAVSDRPIIVRWKAEAKKRPLAVDLQDAWAVVVFTSNSAVEALVAGVPIFVTAPWASTISMANADLSNIESPRYPDNRLPFLWALAEQQWTLSEIASGHAWRAINARFTEQQPRSVQDLPRLQPGGVNPYNDC